MIRSNRVRTILFCYAVFYASVALAQSSPPIDFVGDPRGGGDGNVFLVDCDNAFGYDSIQDAIDDAVDGDFVVILPNDCTSDGRWHERIDFLGKAIRVQSIDPEDEDLVADTVIDGNAAGTVVKFVSGESSDSILDGLTITNGRSPNGNDGGGITITNSAPTIRHCVIRHNNQTVHSVAGGIRVQSDRRTVIDRCRFAANGPSPTGAFGTAIYSSGPSFPTVTDCEFVEHAGTVVFSPVNPQGPCEGTECDAVLTRCRFVDNAGQLMVSAYRLNVNDCEFLDNSGSAIRAVGLVMSGTRIERTSALAIPIVLGIHRSDFESSIIDSVFLDNQCQSTNLLDVTTNHTVRNCRFEGNNLLSANVLRFSSMTTIEDCDFIENECATVVQGDSFASSKIERCLFESNNATQGPGAIRILSSGITSARIYDCDFYRNTGRGNGGAVFMTSNEISNCRFVENSSLGSGGAVWTNSASIRNCLFLANRAMLDGGAVFSNQGIVQGCTVVGNYATNTGGVVGYPSNSIIYDNRQAQNTDLTAQILPWRSTEFCLIQGYDFPSQVVGSSVVMNEGSFDADPRFVDPGHWDDMDTPDDFRDDVFTPGDYHLRADSPAIDGGDPDFVAMSGAIDFDGESRIQSCRVDIGVDEFTQSMPAAPGDFDADDAVTTDDIPGFVAFTLDPYGLGTCTADINADGVVNGLDTVAFVALLIGG